MARECNQCVYSTRDGNCRKWSCEGTKTVDDIKEQGVKEFAKWLVDKQIDVVDLTAQYLERGADGSKGVSGEGQKD